MQPIVLVHGAWMGGWIFRDVARALRARGHEVYTPTLTGLGERSHLARPEVELETHIHDVVNVLRFEDLRDVVLVGHSAAGIVVQGAADRAGDRLSTLVYLDTAPMPVGQPLINFNPPAVAEEMRRRVRDEGEGWRLPFPDFDQLGPPPIVAGLGPEARALMESRAVPQPFRTYTRALPLPIDDIAIAAAKYRRAVIACNGFRAVESTAPKMAAFMTPDWLRRDLETGHWPMLSAPQALAEIIEDLCAPEQITITPKPTNRPSHHA